MVDDIERFNPKTVYDEFEIRRLLNKNIKFIATAILVSALEDADVEFLEDNYDNWKELRLKRKKKSEIITEYELNEEFNRKQDYKETLFDIADIYIKVSDIPQDVLEQRKLFEENKMSTLCKITDYTFDTLNNIAKLHGWKIGVRYVEPTIFDL